MDGNGPADRVYGDVDDEARKLLVGYDHVGSGGFELGRKPAPLEGAAGVELADVDDDDDPDLVAAFEERDGVAWCESTLSRPP